MYRPSEGDAGIISCERANRGAPATLETDRRGRCRAARGAGAPYRLHAYATMSEPPARVSLSRGRNSGARLTCITGDRKHVRNADDRPNRLYWTHRQRQDHGAAALLDRLNRTAERVVVTIEDPVEYVHASIRRSSHIAKSAAMPPAMRTRSMALCGQIRM